jgi:CBS domain-containing protein
MTLVKDIMERDVITIPPRAALWELVERLEESGISGVPVVDEQDTLVGVVSSRDVLRLARELNQVPEAMRWGLGVAAPPREGGFVSTPEGGEFFAYYVTPEGSYVDVRDQIRELPKDVFEGYRVEDIMTPAPFTIGQEATMGELARLLRDQKVHRALVVDSNTLVGIVTTMDLLDVLAEG